jgi:hypothetical protein
LRNITKYFIFLLNKDTRKEFIMSINVNPQIVRSNNISFGKKETAQPAQQTGTTVPVQADNGFKGPKGFLAKIAYAYINASEITKGFVKGVINGGIIGTTIAGTDFVVSTIRKVANKEITLSEAFHHPLKPMGAFGKIVAPLSAALILTTDLIAGRLHANKRTADVDHELHTGHRS